MKQLTGIDASFLYMETSASFGHVSGLSIFERPDVEGWSAYQALRDQIEHRMPLLEPLRRRVVEVPFELDHPYWIRDPDFDLDYHLRETAIPPPGDDAQLANLVARIVGRPLDRSHPLWEAYVIEGLADDRFAILTKIHHATVDGASGAEFMSIMFDDNPDDDLEIDDELASVMDLWRPEPVPSAPEVMRQALTDVLRKPGKLARLQVRSLRAVGELTRNRGLVGLAEVARSFPNPPGHDREPRPDRGRRARRRSPPAPRRRRRSTGPSRRTGGWPSAPPRSTTSSGSRTRWGPPSTTWSWPW